MKHFKIKFWVCVGVLFILIGMGCYMGRLYLDCSDDTKSKQSTNVVQSQSDNVSGKTLSSTINSSNEENVVSQEEKVCDFVPTQLVVKTDSLQKEEEKRVIYQLDSYYVLEYDNKEEARKALEKYSQDKGTQASYVRKAYTMDTGEEAYSYLSWGPESVHSKEFRDKIMDKYNSVNNLPEITVGIIDSGVDYNHEFLKDRMNSYQYDYVSDDDAMDEHFHGTHVAGIIADMTLSNVKFNAYRVADANGQGNEVWMAAGIEQAVKDKVDVINISMGGKGASDMVNAALDKAIAADIVVVVAAGNDTMDASNIWPASYQKALTVSALMKNGDSGNPIVASYSNYGAVIDVCAPGSDIYSSVLNNQYRKDSGTSMATPSVAAAAALLRTYNTEASYDMISNTLKMNATDLGDEGFDQYYGYGEINLSVIDEYITLTEPPEISVDSGEYDEPVEVTLRCSNSEAVIYYTTDGTIPSGTTENTTEKIYTEPIVISKSSVIVAVAKIEGQPISSVASAKYYIGGLGFDDDFILDGRGYINQYKGCQMKLVIPETIQGKTVVGIDMAAFQGNSTLRDVTISDTIVSIGRNAFNFTLLDRVYFGKNVKEIGDLCFTSGLASLTLKEIVVDEENPYLVVQDDVLYTADMEELLIYIPYKTDTTFQIPNAVKRVRYGALQDLLYLKNLEVPASVEELSYHTKAENYGMFFNANNILVNVDADNPYYCSENGILYNKDKTVLYFYSAAMGDAEYHMPDTVQRIYMDCFHDTNMESITLSKNLKVIENGALFNLFSVKSLVIPSTVTTVGSYAFQSGYSGTTSLFFDGDCPEIIEPVVSTFSDHKLEIYRYPEADGFEQLTNPDYAIKDRTDGEYKKSYESYTVNGGAVIFFDRENGEITGYKGNLGDLELPSSIDNVPVKKITAKAFANCNTITSIVIPSSVQEIGEGAFQYCASLTSVKVSGSVQTIPKRAFYNDRILKEIILEEGVQKISREAFGRAWFGEVSADEMTISLPVSLLEIDDYAFCFNTNLRTLDIPEGVREIGSSAFEESQSLSTLTLHKGVKKIGDYAFSGSPILCTLNMPRGITSIGDYAFHFFGDAGEQTVSIRGDAGKFGESVFNDNSTIYYEKGARNFDQKTLLKYNLQTLEKLPYPELRVATNTQILLENISGCEYSNDGGEHWQSSPLFSDLEEGTSYKFCVRKAANNEEEAGEKSEIEIYTTLTGTYEITVEYGNTLGQCTSKLPDNFVFVQPETTKVGEIGKQYFEIRYDTEGEIFEEEITRRVCIDVKRATPYVAVAPVADDITVGELLSDSVICGGEVHGGKEDNSLLEGSWNWKDASIKPDLADSESKKYEVIFEPEDLEHYTTVEVSITIKVKKTLHPVQLPETSISVECPFVNVGQVSLPERWSWSEGDINKELPLETPIQATAIYNGDDASYYESVQFVVTITRISSGHVWNPYVVVKKPTSTEKGEKERTCSICGHKETEEIEATGSTQGNINPKPTGEELQGNNEKTEKETLTKEQLDKNSNQLNTQIFSAWKGKALYIKWGKVKGVQGYDIFVAGHNKKYGSAIKSVGADKTKVKITKIHNKEVSKVFKCMLQATKMGNIPMQNLSMYQKSRMC